MQAISMIQRNTRNKDLFQIGTSFTTFLCAPAEMAGCSGTHPAWPFCTARARRGPGGFSFYFDKDIFALHASNNAGVEVSLDTVCDKGGITKAFLWLQDR
jgi:hypothetical protein